MTTISLIVFTEGYSSLELALRSSWEQLNKDDQLIVAGHSHGSRIFWEWVKNAPYGSGCDDFRFIQTSQRANWDTAVAFAKRQRLVFLRDNSIWVPDAALQIRRFSEMYPDTALVFKMKSIIGETLWKLPNWGWPVNIEQIALLNTPSSLPRGGEPLETIHQLQGTMWIDRLIAASI